MKTLLAGATGYLGGFIAKELLHRNMQMRLIVRNASKLDAGIGSDIEIFQGELTKPQTLENVCKDVEIVISTVGITRQKDGLTYMDVDYQANLNLLNEAKKAGVKKFIYVSVLNGEKLRHLKICEAKEKFVDELKQSGLDFTIIRPNGFFSDMAEILEMAKKGKVYLFGDGRNKANPIHGADLAKITVDAIQKNEKEIEVGGPETLTQNQIAAVAFDVLNKKIKITHIPGWVRKSVLTVIRTFTGSKTYGPIEFFMSVLAMDMVAPEYGDHTIRSFYQGLAFNNHLTIKEN